MVLVGNAVMQRPRIKYKKCQEVLLVEWMVLYTNLSVNANGNRMVPNAYFNSDGSVNRNWNNWDGDWNAGNCFMVLCDSLNFSNLFGWSFFLQTFLPSTKHSSDFIKG